MKYSTTFQLLVGINLINVNIALLQKTGLTLYFWDRPYLETRIFKNQKTHRKWFQGVLSLKVHICRKYFLLVPLLDKFIWFRSASDYMCTVCYWRWRGGWCWTWSTLSSSETISCCSGPWQVTPPDQVTSSASDWSVTLFSDWSGCPDCWRRCLGHKQPLSSEWP